jgi:transposase
MDNAPIHLSADIFGLLMTVLRAVGVRLILLPKYSPELNPCEMVFAQAKGYLRTKRQPGPFVREIARAFATVDRLNMRAYYEHCLFRFDE